MGQELLELLLGIAGAGVALAAVYFFVVNAQWGQDGDGTDAPVSPGLSPRHHQSLQHGEETAQPAPPRSFDPNAVPCVEALYVCAEAGAPMQRVEQVEAVAGRGLKDDRYYLNKGFWSEGGECEVTLIAQEDLDLVTSETGLSVRDGRHRRNIVTRNLDLGQLAGKRFRIGDAYFGGARPRPPCFYLQKLTEPGMAHALARRGGFCVHCFKSGPIREGDAIMILNISPFTILRRRWQSWRNNK